MKSNDKILFVSVMLLMDLIKKLDYIVVILLNN